MVPSGASTGSKEAQEIRDNDKKRFLGKGLKEVIKKTEHQIFDAISQKNLLDQQEIDKVSLSSMAVRTNQILEQI